MFLYCQNCKNIFKEEQLKTVRTVNLDTGFHNVKKCCPRCQRDDFLPISMCHSCGKIFFEEESICPECVKKLKAELEHFLEKYSLEEQEAMLCE